MILEPGVKVLVAHRRLFEGDHARYFVGTIDGYEMGIARMTGHTWIRDGYSGNYRKKKDARTKIVSLASGTVIVYQLPSAIDLTTLVLETKETNLYLRNAEGFQMDLTEGLLHGGGEANPRARLRRA